VLATQNLGGITGRGTSPAVRAQVRSRRSARARTHCPPCPQRGRTSPSRGREPCPRPFLRAPRPSPGTRRCRRRRSTCQPLLALLPRIEAAAGLIIVLEHVVHPTFHDGNEIGESETAQRSQRRQRDFLGADLSAAGRRERETTACRRSGLGTALERAGGHPRTDPPACAAPKVASFVELALTATDGQPLPGSGGLEVPGSNPGAPIMKKWLQKLMFWRKPK
jgi:hypothetical protein